MQKKTLNFWQQLLLTFVFVLTFIIPLGLIDALITLARARYLFYELGDKLMMLGFTLLIYIAVGMIITVFISLIQAILFTKVSKTPNTRAALNFATIIGLIIFLPLAWIYNILFSDREWTDPKSLLITVGFLLIGVVVAFLCYRRFRNRRWENMLVLSSPRYAAIIVGSALVLFVLGQINFVNLFNVYGDAGSQIKKPNVILISIDTLGAKHMSCYGYDRTTSPEMDKIAANGVLFKNAFAQAHWTLPSHMTMLTGLYPIVHGMTEFGTTLDESFVTLAEVLKEQGYRTGAFVDSEHDFVVGADYGYAQGFDFYDHMREHLTLIERLQVGKQFRRMIAPIGGLLYKLHSKETTDNILGTVGHWLSRYNLKKPFFLFIHLYDVHSTWSIEIPYLSPEPYQNMFYPDYQGDFTGCDPEHKWCGSRFLRRISLQLRKNIKADGYPTDDDINYIRATYDGGISYVDSWIGKFFRQLEDLGLEKTFVILTADHGEEFMEHHQMGHRQYYDETLHVPFIVWQKGVIDGGQVFDDPVMSVDIMPTILDAVGVEQKGPLQGLSLLPLIQGSVDSLARAQVFAGGDKHPDGWAVRTLADKFIINSEARGAWAFTEALNEYYNLVDDPLEQTNLCKSGDKCPEELRHAVEHWKTECDSLNEILTTNLTPSKSKLSKAALQKLRALGYVK